MDYIKSEKKGSIAILTLNRPDALNALNSDMIREIGLKFKELKKDDDVRVIIITGEGRAFAAGADVTEMADMDLVEARKFGNRGQRVFRRIEKSEKPTIAAVNGFALGGGCELAMCCDLRIAGKGAVFGQPEVGLGITPGFSATQRLTALIGKAKATELILTAGRINADEALRLGLVNRVVEDGDLMKEAEALANEIASKPRLAVRWSNSAIKRGLNVDIDTGISIEADLFAMCFATEDQKEGMKAFIERREPKFTGK